MKRSESKKNKTITVVIVTISLVVILAFLGFVALLLNHDDSSYQPVEQAPAPSSPSEQTPR